MSVAIEFRDAGKVAEVFDNPGIGCRVIVQGTSSHLALVKRGQLKRIDDDEAICAAFQCAKNL